MSSDRWFRAPRRLGILSLAIGVMPILVLVWLSWRMIEQDRAVERQREQERCESVADVAASALLRLVAELEERLASFAPPAGGADAVLAVFDGRGPVQSAGSRLLFYPSLPPSDEAPAEIFSSGEKLEFQKQDLSGALAAYRELTRSSDPRVRAAAWVRVARTLRKTGDVAGALAALDELKRMGPASVGGLPADLLARQGRAALFEESKRKAELEREASSLAADLEAGRWEIGRATYRYASEETGRWLGRSGPAADASDALALTVAVESSWEQWRNGALAEGAPRGRQSVWAQDRPVLLLWRASRERLATIAAGPKFLERHWLAGIHAPGVRLALMDEAGHSVLGQTPAAGTRQAVRTAAATELPWTLHAVSAGAARAEGLSGRTQLLLAGLSLVVALTLAGSYFTYRAISRELAVARLQSDFVAAVSHEFRTPLTTLMQLSEMLVRGRVTREEKRPDFYATLLRESRRLHRLVEGLLDFGRMETGAMRYRLETADADALVESVVAEFQQTVAAEGLVVALHSDGGGHKIRADRESLGLVIWNLLDNAVKYSQEHPAVEVAVGREGDRVAIQVKDRGMGIPAAEQKAIFRAFVRGSEPKLLSIKGTGIGLSIAQRVVAAHGGEIRVESAPGEGSTFRVLLPEVES